MGNVNIPGKLVGHYEDWADGGMIEVEAVQTKDIPAIVAGELERWAVSRYDLDLMDPSNYRAALARAAELRGDQ